MLNSEKLNEAVLGLEHAYFFPFFMQAPAFLRALLVADGTVTKLIEAYVLESLQVVLHSQQPISDQPAALGLHLNKSDRYLHRKISLVGSRSSSVYLLAESWIDFNLFEDKVHQDFLQAKIGIGEIIQKFALPSCRKMVSYFSEEENQQRFFGRTYVIHVNQQPAIQITEKFPLNLYLLKIPNE